LENKAEGRGLRGKGRERSLQRETFRPVKIIKNHPNRRTGRSYPTIKPLFLSKRKRGVITEIGNG